MTPLVVRQVAVFVAFSVIFCNFIAKDIIASALVSKVNKRQSTREDKIHENTSKFLRPLSDTIIRIGNLDWKLPINDVSGIIAQVITKVSEDEGNADGPNNGDSFEFEVKVAELPVPKRKRDEGKYHQGSATVSFSCAEDARLVMEALLRSSERASESTTIIVKNWKVRWEFVSPNDKGAATLSTKRSDEEQTLSPERIEHRKNRAEKYARKRKRVAESTDKAIESLLARLGSADRDRLTSPTPVLEAPTLEWKACPEEIDPMGGGRIRKGTQRGERKRAAVETFLGVVQELLATLDTESIAASDRSRRTVADLGCGAGNLTVPLAWWLKQLGFDVLGVDINDQALLLLSKRAERLGIDIKILHTDLLKLSSFNDHDPNTHCDNTSDDAVGLSDCAAVVSLHACGAASDLSMAAAVRNNLPFVISPCCIGKISTERKSVGKMPPKSFTSAERSAAPPVVSYPRSAWLREFLQSPDDYKLLAAAADYGVGNSNKEDLDDRELARRKRCKLSKKIIEIDRLKWAKENGYCIRLLEMPRIGPLYPKRELLLGAKKGSHAALKLSQLPTVI